MSGKTLLVYLEFAGGEAVALEPAGRKLKLVLKDCPWKAAVDDLARAEVGLSQLARYKAAILEVELEGGWV